jgi:ubiquinone/menaquinone biosynthesis C-methylase UbiE
MVGGVEVAGKAGGGGAGAMIGFVDPGRASGGGARLEERGGVLVDPGSGREVAPIEEGMPRFVARGGDYTATFGWQWKRWSETLSDLRNRDTHRKDLILKRTRFERYGLEGKTLLECGCGAGNDTEVLVQLPLAEVHSFDLSGSVDLLAALKERVEAGGVSGGCGRLVVSQADMNRIPYADRSFDVVYCHRVLQHTPDPAASLRSICAKVKPGGVLFAHIYQDTPWLRKHWHHKLRWLCKRLPPRWVVGMLNVFAPMLHKVNGVLWTRKGRWGKLWQEVGFRCVPLVYSWGQYRHLGREKELEIEKLITFDMLTAWHEHPMTAAEFRGIIEGEGFTVDSFSAGEGEPLLCTARYTRGG